VMASFIYVTLFLSGCEEGCSEQPDFPDFPQPAPNCFLEGDCPCPLNPFCPDPNGEPVITDPPCVGDLGSPGCPPRPPEPEITPPDAPNNLPTAESFIECGFYYLFNVPDHYLDKATRKVHNINGQIVRDPSPAELNLLTTTAPACTYDLGDSFYDSRQGKIFNYDGSVIDNVQESNIDEIRQRLPDEKIDLGFGFFDPDSKTIFNYGGTTIKQASATEIPIILQQPPENTFPFPPNYYDPKTGFIHNLFGKRLNKPTADQILRIISQPPAGPPTSQPTNIAPEIKELKDLPVREDQIIQDINIDDIVSDKEDPQGDLSLRVFSGDAEKLSATVIQNLITRLILIPNAIGTVPVTFTIEDTDGLESSKTINVIIAPENDAPTILSLPPRIASSRLEYIYEIQGFDVDGDLIAFELFDSPENVILTPSGIDTARVSFQPEKRGTTELITVLVKDQFGGQGHQSWQVEVR